MSKYEGGCLCGETVFIAQGSPINPHLCSCKMCQKSSGAPTVAWVFFPLDVFQWSGVRPKLYQSSAHTQRCFCGQCGSFLGAINDGCENIAITIASLKDPDRVVPGAQHSYEESKPCWWVASIRD